MMIPTLHLNGTSREELLQQILNARGALRSAIDTLRQAYPNGRDYYPQGPDAIRTATAEHQARLAKLTEVYDELETLAEAIDAAPGRR